jgi:hypothetical protein
VIDPAAPPPVRPLSPRLVLVLAVLAGYCLLALFPIIKRRLGIFDQGMWFMDSYAVLASSDAVRAGLDPWQPNPLDILQRPHSYSRWWFGLGPLGFTREDNFLVGGVWVLAFLAVTFTGLRPRTWRETWFAAAVILSPPVVLAVNRANNDLVIFVLLAAGVGLARAASPGRLLWFGLSVVLATGLKFYPIIAAVALLAVRPSRLGLATTAACLTAAGLTLAAGWTDFRQAVFPAPVQVYTFGAPILFRDLGWTGWLPTVAGMGLVGLTAAVCVRRGWSIRLDEAGEDFRERLAFAAGAALLVGCFVAGISHAYRLVFGLLLLPLLWRRAEQRSVRLTGGLFLVVLWLDGLYCLGTNLLVGPMPLAELVRRQFVWRCLTQPVVWAAMALLAGSLLGLGLASWRESRKTEGGA